MVDVPSFDYGRNRTETAFEEDFLDALREWLSDQGYDGIEVESSRPVLKDISYIFDQSGNPEMVFGFSQTDIVFYSSMPRELTEDFAESEGVRLEALGTRDDGKTRSIVYPLAILELKSDKTRDDRNECDGTGTHQLNAYSRKAAEWKSIFPHLKCYLVFSQRKVGLQSYQRNPNEKLLRHVRNFDGVFEFSQVSKEEAGEKYTISSRKGEKEFEQLLTRIDSHLQELFENKYSSF